MSTPLNYIDLFAGCGGLSVGFYQSRRWKGLFAVEVDTDAFASLRHNLIDRRNHFAWPDWLPMVPQDINTVVSTYRRQLRDLRGTIDLVAGGPPCQGFSLAGRRREHDERNSLVHSYLDFISLVRPKAIIFENVKGFGIGFSRPDGARGTPYSDTVLKRLRALGYSDVIAKVVDFSRYGVPQRRERFIIVATRSGQADEFFSLLDNQSAEFLASASIRPPVTVRQAISDLAKRNGVLSCPDSKGFLAGIYRSGRLSNYQSHLRAKPAGTNVIVPDSHRFANHHHDTTRKYKAIIKRQLSSQEIKAIYSTKKHCTILLDGDRVGPTLTTLPDDFIHYAEPRILSPREYARLQTFPDWVEFKGPYTTGGKERRRRVPRYTQIGNAIPPLFAQQSAIVLADILVTA